MDLRQYRQCFVDLSAVLTRKRALRFIGIRRTAAQGKTVSLDWDYIILQMPNWQHLVRRGA